MISLPISMIKKALLSILFCLSVLNSSAQKQLLNIQDLQSITSGNVASAITFLQQKEYHLQSSTVKEAQLFGLFADNDYNDIYVATQGEKTTLILLTTDLQQLDVIQKYLQNYSSKNSKNGKIYKVKNAGISNVILKEPVNINDKVYTFRFEN